MQPDYTVDSFVGPGCSGNRHDVFLLNKPFNLQQYLMYSKADTLNIVVVAYMPPCASKKIQIAYFHRGVEVQYCGSALVAIASVLFKKYPQFSSLNHIKILTPCDSPILLRKNEYFGFHGLPVIFKPFSRSKLWSHLIRSNAITLYSVGGRKGYVVIELKNAEEVLRAKPKFRLIKTLSARAVIITAPAKTSSKYDYVMRYFAPQYGNDEDAATGSANKILAQYWSNKLRKKSVYGRQLSSVGGDFFCKVVSSGVQVFGRVEWS